MVNMVAYNYFKLVHIYIYIYYSQNILRNKFQNHVIVSFLKNVPISANSRILSTRRNGSISIRTMSCGTLQQGYRQL